MVYTGKKRRKDDDEFIDDDDDDDDAGSDSGSGGAARKKSSKKKEPPNKTEDGVTVCELSKNRKVTVRAFKSMILIDIREYYSKKDGDSMPTKKGISLTLDQWNVLRDHAESIDEAVAGLNQ